VTTERGRRLQPELRIRCDARQSGPEVTLAHADGRAVRGHGGTARPGPPGRVAAAPPTRSTKSPVQTPRTRTRNARTPTPGTPDVHTGQWTADRGHHMRGHWTFTPDTGHRTRGRDRALGQGDLDTAGTGQTSRTTTTTRPPAGTPNRGPVDGTCCARQRRRLGDDEVPASARLPTALPGACSVALSAKPRPGALLPSDDYGSSVEREAHGQALWRDCSVRLDGESGKGAG
jgi:hypothetical protein